MRKLRVFKSPQDLITARSSLLAVSNQYGIVYVAGEKNCKKYYQTTSLFESHDLLEDYYY